MYQSWINYFEKKTIFSAQFTTNIFFAEFTVFAQTNNLVKSTPPPKHQLFSTLYSR